MISTLTSKAFGSVYHWFVYPLALTVILFAISTLISWSYYGQKAFTYLLSKMRIKTTSANNIYYGLFLLFTIIGCSSSLSAVIDFSDMMILCMAFPNMIGLIILAPEVKRELKSYLGQIRALKTKEIKFQKVLITDEIIEYAD